MNNRSPKTELEQRAETEGGSSAKMPPAELRKRVDDLQIRNLELERQVKELRASQDELCRARDRYERLYEEAPVGYMALDERNTIRQVNQTLCSLLGFTREDLRGKTLSELVRETGGANGVARAQGQPRVASGGPQGWEGGGAEWSAELRLARADARDFWAMVRCVPSDDGFAGSTRLATVTDISAQKAAEASEREKVEKLNLALESGAMATWDWDLVNQSVTWDSRLFHLLGYDDPIPVSPETFLEHIHPEDRPRVRQRLDHALASARRHWQDEFRIIRSDGRVRWLVSDGRIHRDADNRALRISGVNFDSTARKRVERALRRSEATYRRLAETNLFGVSFGDSEGRITYINDEMLRMMGYSREEYQAGHINWMNCLAPEFRGGTAREWSEKLKEEGQLAGYEMEFLRPDGGRTAFVGASALMTETSNMHVSIALDTTQINAANEELQHLNETLERRVEQRTVQLRALAAQLTEAEEKERQRLAHILHDDLQQQLAVLKIKLSNLVPAEKRTGDLQQRFDRFRGVIDDAIRYTRELSRELSPNVLRLHGFYAALKWLAEDMQEKHGLEVELQLESGAEPQSSAWVSVLFRAVKELLFNVAKHSGQQEACVEVCRQDQAICVRVSDHGCGLDPEAVRQQRESLASFGLLSIEERVSYMGGTVELSGAPGKGCCIRLTLPLSAGEKDSQDAAGVEGLDWDSPADPSPRDEGRQWRILLADDHDVMRESLAAMLEEEEDFLVVGQAATGSAAVRLAQVLLPDVVLMDVSMPELNGIDATALIRRYRPDVQVVGLSMHEDSNTRERMLSAGCCAFVAKGVSPEDLFATIRGVRRLEE